MTNWIQTVEDLLKQGKTSGDNHSEAYLHYTKMNLRRMKRWMEKGELLPETIEMIGSVEQPQKWILLTEAWCGDAAHAYPFIFKMAQLNAGIDLELKLRDENPDLMDQYLTNGGRSIPKLIAFDENGNELFNWGPRPKQMQDFVMNAKEKGTPYKEYSVELQKMYNTDEGESIQKEIVALIKSEVIAQ